MQLENLVILAHVTHRTLVLPGHLTADVYLLGKARLSDFYYWDDLRDWIPVITMDEYLDKR